MNPAASVLDVRDLEISFPGTPPFVAVRNLSMSLSAGQTLAIVGESGSGKSLTALALMGLLPAGARSSGCIRLATGGADFVLSKDSDRQIWSGVRGKHVGMVFQEPMSSLNPVMHIGEQLAESIAVHQHLPKREVEQLAIHWLRQVQLSDPERIFSRYPHQLSGGQKQRVMIAMAMCNSPALLIADEPTTALDVTVQMEVVRLMQDLQRQTGTAIIFITHDLALAATIADKALVMYQGEVVEEGLAQDVLRKPQHLYTRALVASRPSPTHKGFVLPTVQDFLSGADVLQQPRSNVSMSDDAPLLEVNGLRVWFADRKDWLGHTERYYKAVDDVSFSLKKGEVLGLVGESGCGKSTLSKSLLGLVPVREGQIIFGGNDLTQLDARGWKQVRKDIQMIFQDPFSSLNPRMTVGDMLMEPMVVHGLARGADARAAAMRLLDKVQLPAGSFSRYPHQFSGGQRQRLGIARALAVEPKLLICDESVSALDVSIQAQILNLLKDLQEAFSLSYLFISHDLSVVHYISDRVMVMQAGKIVESGGAKAVLNHPKASYTKKLIDAMPKIK